MKPNLPGGTSTKLWMTMIGETVPAPGGFTGSRYFLSARGVDGLINSPPNITCTYHGSMLSVKNSPNITCTYHGLMLSVRNSPNITCTYHGSMLSEVVNLFCQLLLAIQHIHSKKILHRDIKTANILLTRNKDFVKLGDFGISKILASKSKAETVVGTPCYLSPELCEGRPYNEKSDIWALGCVLYEMMALHRAFRAS
ncbi:unnamed protein product, partial [Timema podura]|nr:unnamed protein product [Timema podura]